MVMLKGWTTGRLLALIRRFTGNLSSLTTSSKADLVSAINSLNPQFSSTPAYNVTLAEDVATSSNTPYSIPLATAVPAVFVFLQTAKASGSSQTGIIFKFAISDTVNTDIQVVKSSLLSITYPMYGCAFATVNFYGVAYAFASSGRGDLNGLDGAWSPTALPRIVTSNAKITKIDFWAVNNDVQIPAGTRITIYAAKEAE